jgi:hypothetical protein
MFLSIQKYRKMKKKNSNYVKKRIWVADCLLPHKFSVLAPSLDSRKSLIMNIIILQYIREWWCFGPQFTGSSQV